MRSATESARMATKSRRLCVMNLHPWEFSQQSAIHPGARPPGCVQQTAADLALTFARLLSVKGNYI